MTKSCTVGITYAKPRNKHYVIGITKQPITTLYDVIDITSSITTAYAKHGSAPGVQMMCVSARPIR